MPMLMPLRRFPAVVRVAPVAPLRPIADPDNSTKINNYKLLQSTLLVSENYEGASDFAVALSADLIAARITSLSSFSSWQANFKAS